jgi:hypothetical protein
MMSSGSRTVLNGRDGCQCGCCCRDAHALYEVPRKAIGQSRSRTRGLGERLRRGTGPRSSPSGRRAEPLGWPPARERRWRARCDRRSTDVDGRRTRIGNRDQGEPMDRDIPGTNTASAPATNCTSLSFIQTFPPLARTALHSVPFHLEKDNNHARGYRRSEMDRAIRTTISANTSAKTRDVMTRPGRSDHSLSTESLRGA